MLSPGHAGSITRVSKTPLFIRRTVVDEAVADRVAPVAEGKLSQKPPRVSRPCSMMPPVRLKGAGRVSTGGLVPTPGREKILNSPGVRSTPAPM